MRKPHPLTGFVLVAPGLDIEDVARAGVDIEDVTQADYAIERALAGDLQPLADRLRNAKTLLPEERALAADFIDGTRKVKNPKHRPASIDTRKQQMLLALDVWEQMKIGKGEKAEVEKAAVEIVSKTSGKGERTVRDAVAAHSKMFVGLKRRARARKSVT